jgi:hypothetical protein
MTLNNGGNERNVEAKYSADGKETDVPMGPETAKGSIKWEAKCW